MFSVIYRWRVKPQMEAEFRRAWRARTEEIRSIRGSHGSRLHVEPDGTYCAIALWPSREAWEATQPPVADEKVTSTFEASIAERLPVTTLEVVDDLWPPTQSPAQRLFSHVDLRVKNLPVARRFYDAFLAEFGFKCLTEPPFTEEEPTWRRERWQANDEFIGLTVDAEFIPNQNRTAFHAISRQQIDSITNILRDAGAREIDGPADYDGYYATFFEDPDGNKMEVCYLTHHRCIQGR